MNKMICFYHRQSMIPNESMTLPCVTTSPHRQSMIPSESMITSPHWQSMIPSESMITSPHRQSMIPSESMTTSPHRQSMIPSESMTTSPHWQSMIPSESMMLPCVHYVTTPTVYDSICAPRHHTDSLWFLVKVWPCHHTDSLWFLVKVWCFHVCTTSPHRQSMIPCVQHVTTSTVYDYMWKFDAYMCAPRHHTDRIL